MTLAVPSVRRATRRGRARSRIEPVGRPWEVVSLKEELGRLEARQTAVEGCCRQLLVFLDLTLPGLSGGAVLRISTPPASDTTGRVRAFIAA